MSTRAMIRVYDGDEQVCAIYKHSDGYPDGLGVELREFVAGKLLVNGMNSSHDMTKIANGPGCLAAQIVSHFKDGPGGVYLHAPNSGSGWCSYEYEVRCTALGSPADVLCFRIGDGDAREAVAIPEVSK